MKIYRLERQFCPANRYHPLSFILFSSRQAAREYLNKYRYHRYQISEADLDCMTVWKVIERDGHDIS